MRREKLVEKNPLEYQLYPTPDQVNSVNLDMKGPTPFSDRAIRRAINQLNTYMLIFWRERDQ